MDLTTIILYTKSYLKKLFMYILLPILISYIFVFLTYLFLPNHLKFQLASKNFSNRLSNIFFESLSADDFLSTTHGAAVFTSYGNINKKIDNSAFLKGIADLDIAYTFSHNRQNNSSSINILSRHNNSPFIKMGGYFDDTGIYIDSSDLIKDKMTLPLKFTDGISFNMSNNDKDYLISTLSKSIFSNIPKNNFSSSYNEKIGSYEISLNLSKLYISQILRKVLSDIKKDDKALNILQNNMSNFNMFSQKNKISSLIDEYLLKLESDTYFSNGLNISFSYNIFGIVSNNMNLEIIDELNSNKNITNINLEDTSAIIIDNYIYNLENNIENNDLSSHVSNNFSLKINTKKKNVLEVYVPNTSDYEKIQMATPEDQYLVIYSLNQKLENIGIKGYLSNYIKNIESKKNKEIIEAKVDTSSQKILAEEKTDTISPLKPDVNPPPATVVPQKKTEPKATTPSAPKPSAPAPTVPKPPTPSPAPPPPAPTEKTIKVKMTKTGKVLTMSYSDYLKGVIPSEMPPSYHIEAQKAQAVIANTYALSKPSSAHPDSDVCDSYLHCQAFYTKDDMMNIWASRGYSASLRNTYWNNVCKAVDSVKGIAATYGGKYIEAYYHANSGGKTESVKEIWGFQNIPYLVSVISNGEQNHSAYKSTKKVPFDTFQSKIASKKTGYLMPENRQGTINITEYTVSGRVKTVDISGTSFKGTDIRSLFGLNSTNFTVTYDSSNVIFNVIGYGHGVGMSQTGANYYAQSGWSYLKIIKHYYTGTSTKKAW